MEVRSFIVLIACLSCLVPPGLGAPVMLASGIVGTGLKGAAVGVGLGVAAKTVVTLLGAKAIMGTLLTAPFVVAKGLILKKVAVLGATGLGANVIIGRLSQRQRTLDGISESGGKSRTTPRPLFRDILSGTAKVWQATLNLGDAVATKSRAIYRAFQLVPRLLSPADATA